MNKGEIAFKRLHEIRFHGFQKQSHQSAGCPQVFAGVGRTVALNADNQTVNARAQIIKIVGQTQHSHQFTGNCDIKTGLGRNAVSRTAQARDNVAQHAVIDIQYATPNHALKIDLTLMAGVVNHGSKQVVGGRDRVEVTGKVQVD